MAKITKDKIKELHDDIRNRQNRIYSKGGLWEEKLRWLHKRLGRTPGTFDSKRPFR